MKTTTINTLFTAALLVATLGAAPARADAADATSCAEAGNPDGCCDVTNYRNPTASEESAGAVCIGCLDSALDAFNWGGPENLRECDESIYFSTDGVEIEQALVIDNTEDTGGLVIGNGSGTTKWTNNLAAGATVLTVSGVNEVTIRHIEIKGNSGTTFLRCEDNVQTLILEDVTINNEPGEAVVIDGCRDVQLNGVYIENGTSDAQADVIAITGASGVNISTLELTGAVNGTALKITNATDVSISGMSVSDLAEGTVADLNSITFSKIEITGTDVENGVVLNNVTGKSGADDITLSLKGLRGSTGVGLKLDKYATDLDFDGLYVGYFGGNGVELYDASNDNTFTGSLVEQNVGYGFFITEEASGNTITASTVTRNGDCGVYLDSTYANIVYENELPSNGASCPIGTSGAYAENISASDITLLPIDYDEILVNMARTSIGAGTATYLEMHYLTSNIEDAGEQGTTSASTARSRKSSSWTAFGGSKFATADLGSFTGTASGTARDAATADAAMFARTSAGVGGETSRIEPTLNVSDLPETLSVSSDEESFFAIVTDTQHRVLGLWSGTASADGTRCYTDPYSSETHRLFDEDENYDYDGDGLADREEDKDGDCKVDVEAGETDPDNADTDGDGVNDYNELNGLKTDPNDTDSDDDGLSDGTEDADHDGIIEKENGETDPNSSDTDADDVDDNRESVIGTDPNDTDSDDDSSPDGDDSCPLLHPDQGICYYDSCTPGVELSDDQDSDGDGIRDDEEDADLDCQRDSNETDAGNDDTDGDGIPDGVEDYNQDGAYDATLNESNPLSTDTDGDCISDGKEDKNANGILDSGSTETSPVATDSDGDTIADGDEDYDCDGNTDSGETKAYLADTDGDGTSDDSDICPWNIEGSCIVRYCGISGFSQYDADGDELPDADEDANGDCQHTVSEKESDPLDADTDDDGLTDDLESCYETNPNVKDSDGDGRSDYDEVKNSGDICQPMYNLGDSNPLRAEYGNCSLNVSGTGSWMGLAPVLAALGLIASMAVSYRRRRI